MTNDPILAVLKSIALTVQEMTFKYQNDAGDLDEFMRNELYRALSVCDQAADDASTTLDGADE